MIDLDALDGLAQAATPTLPGDRSVMDTGDGRTYVVAAGRYVARVYSQTKIGDDGAASRYNHARLIAACDPDTVRALVAVARAAVEYVGTVRYLHGIGPREAANHTASTVDARARLMVAVDAFPGAAGAEGEGQA